MVVAGLNDAVDDGDGRLLGEVLDVLEVVDLWAHPHGEGDRVGLVDSAVMPGRIGALDVRGLPPGQAVEARERAGNKVRAFAPVELRGGVTVDTHERHLGRRRHRSEAILHRRVRIFEPVNPGFRRAVDYVITLSGAGRSWGAYC